jgi:signal transduction histidine kinase/CheY-like chemotaxis protein
MKTIDKKLLIVFIPIVIVIFLSLDFKRKSDAINMEYTDLLNDIHQFHHLYTNHLSILKESIINLEFNNDSFVDHFKEVSKQKSTTLILSENIKDKYPELFNTYNKYLIMQQNLYDDTNEFIKVNALIKNSITILQKNIEKNITKYPSKYLESLIKITNFFIYQKNNMNSYEKIDQVLLDNIKLLDKDIKELNYIHIKLLNENMGKFKWLFNNIEQNNVLKCIKEMRTELKSTNSSLIGKLNFELYIIMFVALISLLVVVFLINSIQKMNKNLEQTVSLRTKQFEVEKDKAINATNSKSEFLANMSHEIRTPLNAILGFIGILKNENNNPESYKYLTIIEQASKSLSQIVDDILDFSKIESGKLEIEKVDFDSKKELELIIHLFEAKCLEKDIKLIINIDPMMPQYINTDPFRVKQIISNLLSNAVKFTDAGKKIYVVIDYKEGNLHVSVKDEGKGIAEEKLEHIFEAFSQEDNSTTRKYGGTGLGLSISSELARLLGGDIKVKSTLGYGSEFYFYIPVAIGKEIKVKDEVLISRDFSNSKILLVEDNKANQMFMKVIFKKMNVDYEIAQDGLEAIVMFKRSSYDIVLMDENMPNMNGIEATKHILEYERQNTLKHTPIVALTANALKDDRERFLSAGMDDYLTKPLDKNKLLEVFDRFI